MQYIRVLLLAILVPALYCPSQAQFNVDVSAGYAVVDAEAWNKSIQTFNTARPWLNEQQATFNSGLGFRGSVSYPVEPGMRVGASYEYSSSASEADVFESGISREINLAFNTFSGFLEVRPFVLADSAMAAGDALNAPWHYLALQVGLGINLASTQFSYDGETEERLGNSLEYTAEGIGLLIGMTYSIPVSETFSVLLNSRLHWMLGMDMPGYPSAVNNTGLVGLQSESSVLLIVSGAGIQVNL